MDPRTTLLEPVQTLLKALTTTPLSISHLLSTFTTNPLPLVHEHGLPQLAPFLGRSFTGQDGVARYFELLAQDLDIQDMTFEPEDTWLVDDVAMAVALRGSARFVWRRSGQGWDETFLYRVAVAEDVRSEENEDGGSGLGKLGKLGIGNGNGTGKGKGKARLKVCEYRVWADTGAAYLARLGRLGELVGGGSVDGSGRGGFEGIHLGEKGEGVNMEEGETRRSLSRKRSGGQDVLGEGLNVYGSCG